ncbi:MAG: hypothetical protein SO262_00685 [Lentihominibacter sp.]|nr:hypothetical protein [Lentihominibacter sp.]
MRRSTKGFYTVEAALILPIMIVAVIALSYLIRVESTWENIIHGAADETQYCMLKGYDGVSPLTVKSRIRNRIQEENRSLSHLNVAWRASGSMGDNAVGAYRISAGISLSMPFGLKNEFSMEADIKYRNFVGSMPGDGGIGREGMERFSDGSAVVIFPQEGEKYHDESCTYSVAKVRSRILTNELKHDYKACGLCKSGNMDIGSIVYCFSSKGTAYHRESCRSIDRRTLTMDRKEAIKKGYLPCSKCGGG